MLLVTDRQTPSLQPRKPTPQLPQTESASLGPANLIHEPQWIQELGLGLFSY